MAGDWEDSQVILRGIIAFQALFRGYRTRQAMLAVRDEFTSIFTQIEKEESEALDITWHPHLVISRPSINREICEVSIDNKASCKHVVKAAGQRSTTGYSGPSSNGKRANMGDSEKVAESESEEHNSPTSTNLSRSNLNGECDQLEKTENSQRVEVENCKDALVEDLLTSRESFSDALLQPAVHKSYTHSEEIRPQMAPEDTQNHRRNFELDSMDENMLQALNLDDLKSLTREGLCQKEKEIQMELIWIQQAIESRKQYLKLK